MGMLVLVSEGRKLLDDIYEGKERPPAFSTHNVVKIVTTIIHSRPVFLYG